MVRTFCTVARAADGVMIPADEIASLEEPATWPHIEPEKLYPDAELELPIASVVVDPGELEERCVAVRSWFS
ncbi:MAG: hypothetical protein HYX32_04010 [Actinobacteria bacterium]|nr:hypothetical protein [Actinomycetota bacterium]